MRYEKMFPDQLRTAIKKINPLFFRWVYLNIIHNTRFLGQTPLLWKKISISLNKKWNWLSFHLFYYGAAIYAVEPPENNGTIHVPGQTLYFLVKDIFRGMLRVGLKNIHVFIHHQSENFLAGMPTNLAFRIGAKEALFEYLEKQRGEGQWGNEQMKDSYKMQGVGPDPFRWIKVHPSHACFLSGMC